MIKKIETVLKLKQKQSTDEEGAAEVWLTKDRAVYLGTLSNDEEYSVQVKLQFDAKNTEAIKKILNPVPGQQFVITLRDVSPKDLKLSEFHTFEKELKEPGEEESKETEQSGQD